MDFERLQSLQASKLRSEHLQTFQTSLEHLQAFQTSVQTDGEIGNRTKLGYWTVQRCDREYVETRCTKSIEDISLLHKWILMWSSSKWRHGSPLSNGTKIVANGSLEKQNSGYQNRNATDPDRMGTRGSERRAWGCRECKYMLEFEISSHYSNLRMLCKEASPYC